MKGDLDIIVKCKQCNHEATIEDVVCASCGKTDGLHITVVGRPNKTQVTWRKERELKQDVKSLTYVLEENLATILNGIAEMYGGKRSWLELNIAIGPEEINKFQKKLDRMFEVASKDTTANPEEMIRIEFRVKVRNTVADSSGLVQT